MPGQLSTYGTMHLVLDLEVFYLPRVQKVGWLGCRLRSSGRGDNSKRTWLGWGQAQGAHTGDVPSGARSVLGAFLAATHTAV